MEKGKKMRHPDKTIVFETKAEFDAFKKGFLWERDEYEADLITSFIKGKWQVELLRICDEDHQPGGKHYVDESVSCL